MCMYVLQRSMRSALQRYHTNGSEHALQHLAGTDWRGRAAGVYPSEYPREYPSEYRSAGTDWRGRGIRQASRTVAGAILKVTDVSPVGGNKSRSDPIPIYARANHREAPASE